MYIFTHIVRIMIMIAVTLKGNDFFLPFRINPYLPLQEKYSVNQSKRIYILASISIQFETWFPSLNIHMVTSFLAALLWQRGFFLRFLSLLLLLLGVEMFCNNTCLHYRQVFFLFLLLKSFSLLQVYPSLRLLV